MSINYFEFAVEQARRAALGMRPPIERCGVCCQVIPSGGDLLCPSCRAEAQAHAEQVAADPYRYTRTDRCATKGCVGFADGGSVFCMSCQFKRDQFIKATTKGAV